MQVDWKKVNKDVNKAKKHLKKKADKAAPELNSFIEEVYTTEKNLLIAKKKDLALLLNRTPSGNIFTFRMMIIMMEM